jgi:hypothetical protein
MLIYAFQVHKISLPNPEFHIDGSGDDCEYVELYYGDVVGELVKSVFDSKVLSRCTTGQPYTISPLKR